ncbi:MAG: succinyl-diaminopimelate desuccinylase [Alphaproteobacteria bacterium]|nr:succinyl-diaminopimelate desuccinylase [Alphaproteobacteria bacterium]MDX5369276.1 succinyl-diaminopimelate desuccinylase [Alphaproteobacteria bacterium]MDX5463961.1 succinyl-diaminopimelate desuccinylase [Alphaproteobacteria bacterium]
MTAPDPVRLTADLIRCESVTPADAGALDTLQRVLEDLGFTCTRLPFSEEGTADVDNLYARLGTARPNLCFAGHTDVVPVGARGAWSADPFGAEIRDGLLYGRGAVDMKGAIACFAAAVARFLGERGADFGGSISLMITGDEEGVSINGTTKMVQWAREAGEVLDACVVGEPTNPRDLGDMVKIGRRGSINGTITVEGTQGHVAYPHLADNPAPRLVRLLAALDALTLDQGTEHFQPSNLEITDIRIGNDATNVIPATAAARFNIRFNDTWTGARLDAFLRETLDKAAAPDGTRYRLDTRVSGEAFLTEPGRLTEVVAGAIEDVTGRKQELSTTGGTSDARFIKDLCPVVEFGLISDTMHKVDERVRVTDLEQLTDVYTEILRRYFAG